MILDNYEEGPIKAKIITGKRGRPPIRQVGHCRSYQCCLRSPAQLQAT
jgi:hypothetical protein